MDFTSTVFIANAINGVGALFSFYATYLLGFGVDEKKVFKNSAISAGLLIVGSAMLGSWPAVFLDVIWVCISLLGMRGWELPNFAKRIPLALYPMAVVGAISFAYGSYTLSAFMCAGIYIVGFACLSSKSISNKSYIIWCLIGYIFFVPHLIQADSYSILFEETVSVFLGLGSLFNLIRKDRAVL
jgi:hypothetical protein